MGLNRVREYLCHSTHSVFHQFQSKLCTISLTVEGNVTSEAVVFILQHSVCVTVYNMTQA